MSSREEKSLNDLKENQIKKFVYEMELNSASNTIDDYRVKPNSSSTKSKSDEVSVKKANGYKNSLLEKFWAQRESSPSICDMVICAQNETFHVHKCLMIASCDYFDAMLRSGMQETRASSIELKGVSAQGLLAVVNFIYTGELKLSLANIGEILRAVSHLQVQFALKLCEDYLIEETTVENCIDMLHLAEMFSICNVKNAVNRYILRNFDQLILSDQYKKLTLEQMVYFLQSNKLRLYPEIRVFLACINWLRNYFATNCVQQNDAVYQLMQHIRFNTMKPEEFVDVVTKTDLVKTDLAKCGDLLIEAYEYFALPNRQYCSTSPRSAIRNEPVMVCVNESMYILNRREEIWQYLCQSQATCKTLSQKFVVVNNFLYACGGYSETNRETCNKCHRFDPRSGHWYPIASMNEKRQFFTLASCSEFIVAVGGVYGNVGNFYATFPVHSPLEVYSIEKNTWCSVTDCNVPILKWPGACVFDTSEGKKVFIVGGKLTEGPNHSLSQQSFIVDLNACKVEICSPPITTRFNPSVFYDSVDNKIILFAGEDEKYRLAPCIEIFDLATRQWSEVATIPVSLSYQCISSTSMINSKIYYLLEEHDGPSSESYILKSAFFDINTWQFEMPVQLPHPSTLASKWCTLVFPQEFLERYQNQTSLGEDDLSLALDEGRSFSARKKQSNSKNAKASSSHESFYANVYETINYAPASSSSSTSRLNDQFNLGKLSANNESKFDLYLVRDQNEETVEEDAQTICNNRRAVYASTTTTGSSPSSPSSNSTDLINTYRTSSSTRTLNSTYDTLLTQLNRTKLNASSSTMSRSNSELPRRNNLHCSLNAYQSTSGLDATQFYASSTSRGSEEAATSLNLSASCENILDQNLDNHHNNKNSNI